MVSAPPADMIRNLRTVGVEAALQDTTDEAGRLSSVQIQVPDDSGLGVLGLTYYASEAACSEALAAARAVDSRYE